MDTVESIHIETTTPQIAVMATFAYAVVADLPIMGSGAQRHRTIDVEWMMDRGELRGLLQMLTGAPGASVPLVRVTGSVSSESSAASVRAVRARPVIEWNGDEPTVSGLQLELTTGDLSHSASAGSYCTLGLQLDVIAWSVLRAAVESALRATSPPISP